jgi:NitT/TauT family transport system permease protein
MQNKTRNTLFWGVHAQPGKGLRMLFAFLPFLLLLIAYMLASEIRHNNNPSDKLLPRISQMGDAIQKIAFTEDKRTGKYLMLQDTVSSLRRLLIGVSLAALTGLLLGLNLGLFPGFNAMFNPFVTFVSMIPPLAILPILFISFGVDELAKIMLIFIGVFPLVTRDIRLTVNKIPREQITKAATLGATQLQLAYKILLPQILPRLIEAIRLTLGAAWLFLIAAEAIASSDGLGYRIFLVRRYLAMDIILPYVLWITFLGFSFDMLLKLSLKWFFPWYSGEKNR